MCHQDSSKSSLSDKMANLTSKFDLERCKKLSLKLFRNSLWAIRAPLWKTGRNWNGKKQFAGIGIGKKERPFFMSGLNHFPPFAVSFLGGVMKVDLIETFHRRLFWRVSALWLRGKINSMFQSVGIMERLRENVENRKVSLERTVGDLVHALLISHSCRDISSSASPRVNKVSRYFL
ncbi:hypothetical protein CDAR_117191 [Caerostris darwini]|uniref:Uncharacterized protein n=1 Tax=Caerostris darwini TaxID=1538125 RepID=A0AAV4U544_9ARAC|nr:hypothetical protein CDAR_117191 [Caerostris darwini]